MSYSNRRLANRQMMPRNRFVSPPHFAASLCLLFKKESVSRLSICMLTKSNRSHFASRSFLEAQSWSTSSLSYCFLIDVVSSKIWSSTRDRSFHTFSILAQLWTKSNSIRNDFEKASFFESSESLAFLQTSVSSSIVLLTISWEQSQLWASLIRWARSNECSFIFECESCSFVVFEYHSLL